MFRTALKLTACLVLCAWIVEVIFCYFILPERLDYIESSYSKFPHFWLVQSFKSNSVVIEDGKRQVKSSPGSRDGIAFIGDSVTFGSELKQAETLPQLVADQFPGRLVENFGVPGYGLREYIEVVKSKLEAGRFSHVVVTLLSNDVYPASAGRLGLLIRRGETITYWNAFDQTSLGRVKDFLFRYFKTGYFVLASSRDLVQFGQQRHPVGSAGGAAPTTCSDELLAADVSWERVYERHSLMFRDERVRRGLADAIAELTAAIEAKGAKPIFVLHYYLGELRGKNPEFRQATKAALESARVPMIDMFEVHQANYAANLCDYFADPGHPGPRYSKDRAEGLKQLIRAQDAR